MILNQAVWFRVHYSNVRLLSPMDLGGDQGNPGDGWELPELQVMVLGGSMWCQR